MNRLERLRTKIRIWFRNRLAGLWTKHFTSLQEMDTWIEEHGPALVHWGILRWDIFSPLQLSCIITLDDIKEISSDYIDKGLRDMFEKLQEHFGKWCRDGIDHKSQGVLCGIEVTQEDYYWVLLTGYGKTYISGAIPMQVEEHIRDNIVRYSYI